MNVYVCAPCLVQTPRSGKHSFRSNGASADCTLPSFQGNNGASSQVVDDGQDVVY